MSQNREVLFHARFPKSGFVSHFKGIGRKRETNGHFRKVLPLKEPPKTMKLFQEIPATFYNNFPATLSLVRQAADRSLADLHFFSDSRAFIYAIPD
jgi:hypothetical protein